MGKRYKDDYERELAANEKRLTVRKKSKKRKKHIVRRIIGILLLLVVIVGFIGAGVLIGIINGTEKLTKEDLTYNNLTTFIYDKNGAEYATLYSGENRILVSLTDMPKYLPDAFISIEDERFMTHFGIDIKRTGYAIFTWITHGGKSSFGGSTITQQLVKNITGDKKSDPIRKVREWIRAVQVETWLSKEEIMEMYLNIIFLGGDNYGVQSASYNMFGKDVSQLSLAECATIAGITHSPNAYNGKTNYDKIKARQEVVLSQMLKLDKISREEYDEAVAEQLVFKSVEIRSSSSYIVEAIIDKIVDDIVEEKKTTKAVANKMVYGDGLKIYTNIDPEIQASMEAVYANESYFPLDATYQERPQSAMVVIENGTGAVVGLVGGAGDKVLRGLNRAVNSKRQPGSTIKPIAVYGPGIDRKIITASTVYDDIPTTLGNWTVNNWNEGYAGLSTVRKGIEKSMNIVAAKALKDVGVETAYMYLEKMGITTLVPSDKALTLALGGILYGVTPFEMCGAYSTIANQGQYIEPELYKKVLDKSGNLLIENTQLKRNVMSKQAAYIVLDMMRDVVRGANGTATYINVGGNPVAAKTGSTDSNKDRWFCAFTPYYTGSVWYGFDTPKRVRVSGQNPAAKIWNVVMKDAHKDLAIKEFIEPEGLVTATICVDSGKLAGNLCSQDQRGTRVRTEIYIAGTEPTEVCDVHVAATICTDSNKIACTYCPLDKKKTLVFLQRNVLLEGVEEAADYKYEIPKEICDVHMDYSFPVTPANPSSSNTSSTSGTINRRTNNSGNTQTPDTGSNGYL